MGQVLAVQELLCLLCLHDQAAKMFSSSKSAVQESTLRNSFLACGQTSAGSTESDHGGNTLHRTHTHILYTHVRPNSNYRGPQSRGQPHRDVVGLC